MFRGYLGGNMKRKRSREIAMELLFSMEISKNSYEQTIESFIENYEMDLKTIDLEYIKEATNDYQEEVITEKVPIMYPVGLVKGTYIICQNELGMYMIDQHAANERVNYEYYYYALCNLKDEIDMLVPITI